MERITYELKAPTAVLESAIVMQMSGRSIEDISGEMLSSEVYEKLRETILSALEIEYRENPYHNRAHTEEVESRFLKLADEAQFSPYKKQLGALAALFHDFGHAGKTIRQQVSSGIERNDISNEEYSAIKAGEMLKPYLPEQDIHIIQSAILGTSFGQMSGEYARPYKPLSSLDTLVAFADIAGFTKGFHAWMEESMDVYREMSFENLPKDYEAVKQSRRNFLAHVLSALERTELIIGPEHARAYRTMIDELREKLDSEDQTNFETEFKEIREMAKQSMN